MAANRQPTEKRKVQIAQAALKIIAEEGLGKFTTAAIAKEVGIADGTVFRHFDSKDSIVAFAIEMIEKMMFSEFPTEHPDPIERLGIFIRQRFQLVSEQPVVFKIFFSDQLAQAAGEEGAEKVRKLQRSSLEFVYKCLIEASEQGLLKPGAKPEQLMIIINGTIIGSIFSSVIQKAFPFDNQSKLSPAKKAEQIWESIELLIRR